MEISDAILVAIKAAGGTISGRTAIQKLVYFAVYFKLVESKYKPHYYGPYSTEVSTILQELTYLNFINEEVETRETTGFTVSEDWKRYFYTISKDGDEIIKHLKNENKSEYKQISDLVKICKETANLDGNTLSWAAKVHYILLKQDKSMTPKEVTTSAQSFGWDLSKNQIKDGEKLLIKLHLAE